MQSTLSRVKEEKNKAHQLRGRSGWIGDSVADVFVAEKKLEKETKGLETNTAHFARQTHQWLDMMKQFRTNLKARGIPWSAPPAKIHFGLVAAHEVGDFQNWAKTVEWDMCNIASALDNVAKSDKEAAAATYSPAAALLLLAIFSSGQQGGLILPAHTTPCAFASIANRDAISSLPACGARASDTPRHGGGCPYLVRTARTPPPAHTVSTPPPHPPPLILNRQSAGFCPPLPCFADGPPSREGGRSVGYSWPVSSDDGQRRARLRGGMSPGDSDGSVGGRENRRHYCDGPMGSR